MYTTEEYITKVPIKESEFYDTLDWMDTCEVKCGDDGWIPSLFEVQDGIARRYDCLVDKMRQNRSVHARDSATNQKKNLLFLMMWITETCSRLPAQTYKFCQDFMKEKFLVLPDEDFEKSDKGENHG